MDTLLERVVSADEAVEPEIACDVFWPKLGTRCGKPADWDLITRCTGEAAHEVTRHWCDSCYQKFVGGVQFCCAQCGKVHEGSVIWITLLTIVVSYPRSNRAA